METSSIVQGSTCWLIDEKRGFQIVEVLKVEAESNTASVAPLLSSFYSDATPWSVDIASLHTDAASIDQLVNLKDFSTSSVVNSLLWRSKQDRIYTQCGLFTIAMNPFKEVKGAFGPEQIQRWRGDAHGEVVGVPHAYSVVEKAYQGMSERQIDQSILVSGMSGAGKSETVKICINYLSSIGGGQSQLEKKINDAGMVLESFGNAFTVHNANSSRFGKYTKMFFEHGKPMVGAEIKTYLLEKTRVAHPPEDERNFHVFYQILHGMSDARRADLHLTTASDYQILKTLPSSTSLLATVGNLDKSDAETYTDLLERLVRLGFTEEDIESMAQVLAAILHLGNVSFGEKRNGAVSLHASTDNSEHDDGEAFIKNTDTLEIAAKLLGVDCEALGTALTRLNLKSIQSAVLPLTRVKAELSRDSLIGEIYERLFEWIVSKLNEAVECSLDPDDCGYIAILDISGYESVAKNGFEQININYTNDKLQQLYNEMLYAEQEEYRKEFGWQPIEFDTDLKDLLAVIEGKPEGVLPLLDNVCYRQTASDAVFVMELGTYTNSGTPRASTRKTRGIHSIDPDKLKFGLHHAPGPVDYSAKGFVIKNRDILASALELLMASSSSLCAELFSTPGQKGQTSVAKFYVEQLADLMDAIRETDYSFIKCVKPNAQNKPNSPDRQYIADQIKWSGVIETLQVCSKGFPEHIAYDKFAQRFGCLVASAESSSAGENEVPLATTRKIVAQCLNDTTSEVAFGNTQLYLSMSALFRLTTLKTTQAQNPAAEGGWISKAKSAFGWLWSSDSNKAQ